MRSANIKPLSVPYGLSVHGEEEVAAVVAVLRSSTQMGDKVAAMEDAVSALLGKTHGVMVNSGSSANYLAVDLAKLPAGSEVVTPVLTFATTVAPIVKSGLLPVFVDANPATYTIDVDAVESSITSRTSAMMVPNLLGNIPDWPRLADMGQRRGLVMIEDSADTVGATIGGVPTGRYSHISTTSFYGSHVINCAGNGGMTCVNSPEHYHRGRLLRSWGRRSSLFGRDESEAIAARFDIDVSGIPYDAKFLFDEIGYNWEPSELGAAFGLVQLRRLGAAKAARQANWSRLRHLFARYEEWFALPEELPGVSTAWLAFPTTLRDVAPFSRTDLQLFLEEHGIQTRPIFTGNILKQPGFSSVRHGSPSGDFPVADAVTRGGLLLGCHQGMTEEMICHLEATVQSFVDRSARA